MSDADPALIETLCRHAPFDDLSQDLRAHIAPDLRRIEVAADETLLSKGDMLEGALRDRKRGVRHAGGRA